MKELIAEVTIPLYIRNYKQSDKAMNRYYIKGGKEMPLMYCNKELYEQHGLREPNGIEYVWHPYIVTRLGKRVLVDHLIDTTTGNKVIANAGKAGKPKYNNINGQGIYNGSIKSHDRNKMMGAIKDQMRGAIINSEWGKSLEIVEKIVEIKPKGNKETIKGVIYTATKPIQRYPIRIMVQLWDNLEDLEFLKNQEWDLGNRILPYNKAFEDVLTDMSIITDDCTKFVTGSPAPLFYPLLPGQQRKLVYGIFVDRRPCILNNEQYKKILGSKLG